RLKHPVALDYAPRARVEPCPVQGLRNRADQRPRGTHGEPGVGIEGDDVAYPGRRRRRPAAYHQQTGARRPAQQPVSLNQLPAVALPPDPPSLGFVPTPGAMEE